MTLAAQPALKSVASSDFKQAMRYLAGAVTIVTTGSGAERRGLTATAVCSLSADPPRVIACINRNGTTYEMISKSRKLGINILSAGHQSLAMRFAGMKDIGDVDRFDEGRWRTLTTGAPILDDALTAFDCTLNVAIDVGSHAIIVAEIVDIKNNSGGEPLLYMESAFKTIAPAEIRAAAAAMR
ncbi:MAG: flavin reductase family protein [Rhizobiaceae bacterium]|nr:flavin reductase family protein [Rhizobiaceae bacterium]